MNPAPPPQPRKTSGCLIALFVLGGLVLLCIIAAGIGLVVFVRSDTGKKVVSVVQKGGKVLGKSLNAPGTRELQKLGCSQALVIDSDDVVDVVSTFTDGGMPSMNGELIVVCQMTAGLDGPSCNEVAQTYVAAVGRAQAPFMVSVAAQGQKAQCTARFSASGEPLPEPRGRPGTNTVP